MSKGSTRRPRQVKQETYAANWDAVFGLEAAVLRAQEDVVRRGDGPRWGLIGFPREATK